jgi:14-3-3 protein epsilon
MRNANLHLKSAMTERKALVALAELADKCNRHDDMAEFMRQLIFLGGEDLSDEERRLFIVAGQVSTNGLRNAVRGLRTLLKEGAKAEQHIRAVEVLLGNLDMALRQRCLGLVSLIDDELLPRCRNDEGRVLYWKLKGDYLRYLVDNMDDSERSATVGLILNAYHAAEKLALQSLSMAHPVVLDLKINMSVFYFEVLGETTTGQLIAESAMHGALEAVYLLPADACKESLGLVAQLEDVACTLRNDGREPGCVFIK